MNNVYIFILACIISSCAWLTGPDGIYPDTKEDFFDEVSEENLILPTNVSSIEFQDHYPVEEVSLKPIDIPKPKQIFSSDGDSSVQLRRLGKLMWIYIETLPSSTWPISRSYWDNSIYSVIEADPDLGIIKIDFSQNEYLEMRIEHGIKEASSEVFLQKKSKSNDQDIQDIEYIELELKKIVEYFAESASSYSGTSLAAQNLNDRKKTRIFSDNGQTIIELDLSFDRAWSSVSRALKDIEINPIDVNRDAGIFFVNYSENKKNNGFKLFSFSNNNNPTKITEDSDFIIKIEEKNKKSYVSVISNSGKISVSEKLLSLINESLS